jgi:phosphate transport system protein
MAGPGRFAMRVHLQKELAKLKKRLISLSALVEENLRLAIKSIERADSCLAEMVRERDKEIDNLEVEIEEDCLKILALHQPVATDLRFLICVLKMNNDLERIGDLAVNIAERAGFFSTADPVDMAGDLPKMAARAQSMLRRSLDSVVNLDTKLAEEILQADEEIDGMHRQVVEQVKKRLQNMPVNVEELLQVMVVSKHIERIADLATNIAEDTIYMVEGKIVRHGWRPAKTE